EARAEKAVDEWLDACLASHDAAPADCPFGVVPDDGIDLSDLQWHLDHRPYTSIAPQYTKAGGWPAASGEDGRVEATATLTRSSDGATGSGTSEVITFGFQGVITFDGSKAVFTPYFADSQDQQG
ncbi:hypothetical protein, partial [Kitasatospora herbaricolor]|uniref:hypothetical protein n=1 Tax=Kitasatospora herbaricolor TaxID=68217 RepID=UPI0036DF7D76